MRKSILSRAFAACTAAAVLGAGAIALAGAGRSASTAPLTTVGQTWSYAMTAPSANSNGKLLPFVDAPALTLKVVGARPLGSLTHVELGRFVGEVSAPEAAPSYDGKVFQSYLAATPSTHLIIGAQGPRKVGSAPADEASARAAYEAAAPKGKKHVLSYSDAGPDMVCDTDTARANYATICLTLK